MAKYLGIPLRVEDMREGLRLEREIAEAHDLLHVAENTLKRYVGQLGALYAVPDGWRLVDWIRGFEPVVDDPGAVPARLTSEGINSNG